MYLHFLFLFVELNELIKRVPQARGGVLVQQDFVKRPEAALISKNVFDSDADLQALMSEYEADRVLLGQEFSKPDSEIDEKAIADIRARIQELTQQISANPVYIAFATAQNNMNKLMADVNAEIKFCITGERDNCTHDCSTCSGCH